MNGSVEPCVFVLDTPRAVPQAWPLAQACARAGMDPAAPGHWPALTAALRAQGAAAVLVSLPTSGVDAPSHWLDAAQARGWIVPQANGHLDNTALLSGWRAQLERGHVPADAALLAWPELPLFSWGDAPAVASTSQAPASPTPPLGLYAIVDSAAALRGVLEAGVRTVQLRVKRPADADAAWAVGLRRMVRDSVAAADAHGALLVVNDHWRLAAEEGARAVHLGQEDLLALDVHGHAELHATGLALGVSSHAVWELCRARSLAPRYIACGPVWPTTTKDMPWRPQGLDNLAWWCRAARAPVVAIGGILTSEQVRQAAAAGASGVCVLRGLGGDPGLTVATLQQAFERGRQEAQARAGQPVAALHPTLENAT